MQLESGQNTTNIRSNALKKRIDQKKRRNKKAMQTLKIKKGMEIESNKSKDPKTVALDHLKFLNSKYQGASLAHRVSRLFKEENVSFVLLLI